MKKYYEEHEDWYGNETEAVKQRYEWLEETCRLEMKSFEELQYKRITGTDGEKRFINDFGDYFKHYGIETYDMAWVEKECVNVAFFFILDEAKQYQKYYAHNLVKSRIYTYFARYDNRGDFTHCCDLLLKMGQELNKETVTL
ncbi:hypothetical protein CON48_13655 [Bacillus thuringiensis]|uniref:TipAS antibiotic-recognition domain-containing protein n=1 Tax=Bacillus thuringiensis TaxID=1428 RepID=A0ABD6SC71_BACTU|nr:MULTISPECIES: hypothetical protein [Bacillus cereus group]EOO05534.1 hypothetical protein IAW_05200 [Bacillus cereus str. Schrouff]EOO82033.1 hypothetical protein IGY_05293 [Bacillus cereus K-5975c]MBJ8090580.1 hypothetical protein [Bacillus cereus]MCU4886136.1 hypothetical protein [Bacillus cereus]MCU4897353.1 hypothetical protein [Bacillus cereus]